MLASKIVDLTKPESKDYSLAYFYCNYKEAGRRDPASILRALIKQICLMSPGGFPKPVLAIYQKRKTDGDLSSLLSVEESKDLFVKLSAGFLQTTILIDALDECDKSTRGILFGVFEHIISSSKQNPVKIFVTSRDDGDLRRKLQISPDVYIQEGNNSGDIGRYIDAKVESCIKEGHLLDGEVDDNLKEHIINTLREGAHGMFIWVQHQITKLCDESTKEGVKRALTELPQDLDDTYSEILERIQTGSRSLRTTTMTQKVLTWILYAVRPLSPGELIQAVSVEPTTNKLDSDGLSLQKVLDICQNLVVYDEKLEVLRFAHFSVQEFLLSKLGQKESHTKLAEVCLTFLIHHYEATDNEDQETSLAYYCTYNWPEHVRSSGDGSHTLEKLWKEFLRESPAYMAWTASVSRNIWELEQSEEETLAPLLVACFYQLDAPLKFLLGTKANLNSNNRHGHTPLHLVAMNGNIYATLLLLERGVDVDSKNSKNEGGKTPLSYAAIGGYEKIVQIFLESGAEADSKDEHGRTPLSYAAEGGYEKIVQILLESGAGADSKGEDGQTPLSYAVERGHEKIVQILLESGAEADSKDKDGHTPLAYAAHKGYEKIAQILLESGAEADSKNEHGWTPLSYAAEGGYEKIVQILLESRAGADSKDKNGQTPLSYAARRGHGKLVQILLESGTEADSKDEHGRTPLSYAAEGGHEKIVQILRERGAEVDSKDEGGRTPLSYAVIGGYEKIVQILLGSGAEANWKDEDSRTPLPFAAE